MTGWGSRSGLAGVTAGPPLGCLPLPGSAESSLPYQAAAISGSARSAVTIFSGVRVKMEPPRARVAEAVRARGAGDAPESPSRRTFQEPRAQLGGGPPRTGIAAGGNRNRGKPNPQRPGGLAMRLMG